MVWHKLSITNIHNVNFIDSLDERGGCGSGTTKKTFSNNYLRSFLTAVGFERYNMTRSHLPSTEPRGEAGRIPGFRGSPAFGSVLNLILNPNLDCYGKLSIHPRQS